MKMKMFPCKGWGIVVLCVLLVFAQVPLALAQPQLQEGKKVRVIKECKEITDPDQLLKRAKNNITDMSAPSEIVEKIKPEAYSINCATGEKKKSKTYKTTQLLKITEENGVRTNYYATTAIGILITGQQSVTTDDPNDRHLATGYTGDVAAYVTIYYTDAPKDGVSHTKLYKTTGKWRVIQSGCVVSNGSVTSKAIGASSYPSLPTTLNYSVPSSNLSGFSWSYSNLRPIQIGGAVWNLGSITKCKVTRGASSWYMYMSNSLTGQNMYP